MTIRIYCDLCQKQFEELEIAANRYWVSNKLGRTMFLKPYFYAHIAEANERSPNDICTACASKMLAEMAKAGPWHND